MRLLLLLLLASLLLTACGQKGELYKTPAPTVNHVDVDTSVAETEITVPDNTSATQHTTTQQE